MRYSDFFSGKILVKLSWEDDVRIYWRYVEGNIASENDQILTLEDAYIYTSLPLSLPREECGY